MDPGHMIDLRVAPVAKVENSPDHQVKSWYTLRLIRFRRFEDFTLPPIPSTGIVLLDGKNGIGKSTIFDAISFVMYDNAGNSCYPRKDRNSKKKQKPTSVELTFPNGLRVYRQRRPNLLRVNGPSDASFELLDDVAQGYINATFGLYNGWLAGGYLEQNAVCSFFSMSSADKLEFLQELSRADRQGSTTPEQLERYLSKSSEKYNLLTQQLSQIEFQIKLEYEMYMRLHTQMPEQFKLFQYKDHGDEDLNDTLTKAKGTNQEQTQRLQTKISETKIQLARVKEQETQRNQLEETKKRIEKQLDGLRSTEELMQMEKDLRDLIEQIAVAQRSERRSQLITIKTDLQARLEKIPDSGVSIYTSTQLDSFEKLLAGPTVTELEESLKKLNQALEYHRDFALYQKRESLRSQVEGLQRTLEQYPTQSHQSEISELSKQIWSIGLQDKKLFCPKCKSTLHLNNGLLDFLEIHDCPPSSKLSELNQKKGTLEREEIRYLQREQIERQYALAQENLRQFDLIYPSEFNPNKRPEINATVPQIELLIGQIKHLREQRAQVPGISVGAEREKLVQAQDRLRLKRDLSTIEVELSSIVPGTTTGLQTDLQTRKRDLETKISELRRVEMNRVSLSSNLRQVSTQIQNLIPVQTPTETLETLEKELESFSLEAHNRELELQAQIYLADMQKIFQKYESHRVHYQELYVRIASLGKIRNCLITAEYIVLDNLLSEINTVIAEVMEQLFSAPCSLTLRSMKQLKVDDRIKPEINYEIVLDGEECNSIKEISGGERSRFCLAMIIAFSKYNNVPFVFLDEALSPMDVVARESTISTIRKYLGDKLVITVNHDTTKGVYDSVISLE